MDLENLLSELRTAREEAAGKLAELDDSRKSIIIELDRIDGMIRAGGGGASRKKATREGAAPASPEVVSAVLAKAEEYAQQEGPAPEIARGAFTRQMIVKDLDLHPSSIDKALRHLRTTHQIRSPGKVRLEGSPRASILNILVPSEQ